MFIFLLQLVGALLAASCPAGYVEFPDQKICLRLQNQSMSYLQAERSCEHSGGDIIPIRNAFINALVTQQGIAELDAQSVYIGVEQQSPGVWTYADGSPLNYTRWKPGSGEPLSSHSCTILNPMTSYWETVDCGSMFASVCASYIACEAPWQENAKFDSCYYVQNASSNVYYDFTTAEQNCQNMGGHLVSIHSQEEAEFVMNLIYMNGTNSQIPSCAREYSWIGLSRTEATDSSYTWTDGTPVDYLPHVTTSITTTGAVEARNNARCGMQYWHMYYPSDTISRFVCKKPSSSPTGSDQNAKVSIHN